MPNPIEILMDPISIAVFIIFAALILIEALFPARSLPAVRGWKLRGIISFIAFFYISSYLPMLWAEHFARFQLLDLTWLGTLGGAAVGLFLYEFGVYVWHRSMHASNILWRGIHQMHHSAERIDTYGAFWFSPLDMIGWTVLSSVCLSLVIGLTPQAVTVVLLVTTFLSVFQHSNLRTPRWLGYFIQRPESHSRHHERGIHAGNYSDLPLFDIVFGTFHNPQEFSQQNGFYHGASERLGEMLCFHDVSNEVPVSASSQRAAAIK